MCITAAFRREFVGLALVIVPEVDCYYCVTLYLVSSAFKMFTTRPRDKKCILLLATFFFGDNIGELLHHSYMKMWIFFEQEYKF